MQIDFIDDLKTWAAYIQNKIRKEPRNTLILFVALAVMLVTFLLVAGREASLDLKVEAGADSTGIGVFVTNTGTKPIGVLKITVNNRKECTETYELLFNALGTPLFPRTLNVGDKTGILSDCQIIWVKVDTDRGSEEYDFRDSR